MPLKHPQRTTTRHRLLQTVVASSVAVWLAACANRYMQAETTFQGTDMAQQEISALSDRIWQLLLAGNAQAAAAHMHEEAVFVHMGATLSKKQEVDAINSKTIVFKHSEVQEKSVRMLGDTAILLRKIRLTAVVGGQEVINPFVVAETYVRTNGTWLLAAMTYTRIVY